MMSRKLRHEMRGNKMKSDAMKDMTTGSPWKLILGFFIPMVFGLLFQQLYNMADTIIVGKYLGVEALAAVGSTGSINFMVIGFCVGVCNGFAIPVAQKFGEKNFGMLRRFAVNGAYMTIVFAVVMTCIVGVLCRQILIWMNTPENIMDGAYQYIFIIFMGIPATYLYNMVSGLIRSMGDSRTPLFFLLLSSGINVCLDLYFIIKLNMGVVGAAWATVIAQAISGVLCFLYMRKTFDILRPSKEEAVPDKQIMITLCNMGIPMGLQYSITAIGGIILQTAVNGLGAMAVAAVTAGSKISMFFTCPFEAMGSTIATYGGQNMGAKKLDRIRAGLRCAVLMAFVYAILAFVVLYFLGDRIALLFMDAKQSDAVAGVLADVRRFLFTNTLFYFALSLVIIVRFLIQGMGYSKLAILAGVCEMIARTVVGVCLVPFLGYAAVCFSNPAAWVAADLFLVPSYLYVMKKLEVKLGKS